MTHPRNVPYDEWEYFEETEDNGNYVRRGYKVEINGEVRDFCFGRNLKYYDAPITKKELDIEFSRFLNDPEKK